MATDGPTPSPMSEQMSKDGKYIMMVGSWITSNRFEQWTRMVQRRSGQQIDWHMYCGRACVKYIGNRKLVEATIMSVLVQLQSAYDESIVAQEMYANEAGPHPVQWCWLTDDGTMI